MVETRISFKYLLKRVAVSVVILWVILTLLFLLLKAMPGDITDLFLNPNLEPEDLQNLREQYGLNDPLWESSTKSSFPNASSTSPAASTRR